MSVIVHAFRDEAEAAGRLAGALGAPLAFVEVHAFPDGEILPCVPPAADTVIVYRSLDRPNPKLVELLLAQDAWSRSPARRLVLVAPYLCYMRQDKVDRPGAPISQEAVGAFLAHRFDRVLTVDPHLHRTPALDRVLPGVEATCVSASAALAGWIAEQQADAVLVGPDAESRRWVEPLALADGRPWLTLQKVRDGDRAVRVRTPPQADLAGRPAILVDDVCSTGETLIAAAEALVTAGAGPIRAFVTHALFDDSVGRRLAAAGVESLVSTDAVVHSSNRIPLAGLLAAALEQELSG
ncbi:MAG: ribose-phosphate diphosphokinase [Caulobacteraceae bacterium]|nr:ribose-phosphate diphosphokinase [Caulobacteraceae bacterium]